MTYEIGMVDLIKNNLKKKVVHNIASKSDQTI